MFHIKLVTVILILVYYIAIFEARDFASKLCNRSDFKPTCSKQLWGLNDSSSDCTLWNPGNADKTVPKKNTIECFDSFIDTETFKASSDLGRVKLRVYVYTDPSRSPTTPYLAFNSTFSDIKWEDLKMRYKQNQGPPASFCREFTIAPERFVPSTSKLFYDCLWSWQEYQGKTYIFEYQARKGSFVSVGKFIFNVPNLLYMNPSNVDMKKSELFMYIDLSSIPVLKLHLQMSYDRSNNFTSDNYIVQLHYMRNSGNNWTAMELKPTVIEDDALTYEYDTAYTSGNYKFKAYTRSSELNESWSPIFTIPENNSILLIAIVGLGAVVLSVVFFAFFIWRQRSAAVKKPPPTMLIIYAPTTSGHRLAAVELAKFLSNFCHVNALIDDIDIPRCRTRDPFIWCNEAFNNSKFVMVLSSPFHECNNYEGIYRKVDALGLRLMRENMGDRRSTIKFFSALLPYCTSKDIPAEAKNFRQFTLLKDLDKMLGYLHSGSSSLFNEHCIEPLIFGGKRTLGNKGQNLLRAIDEAKLELAGRGLSCNCSHVDHSLRIEPGFVEVELNDELSEFFNLTKEENKNEEELYPIKGHIVQNLNLFGEDSQSDETVTDSAITLPNGFDINSLKL